MILQTKPAHHAVKTAVTFALSAMAMLSFAPSTFAQGAPQYGQPAGNALDMPSSPYGQPAGNALDQPPPSPIPGETNFAAQPVMQSNMMQQAPMVPANAMPQTQMMPPQGMQQAPQSRMMPGSAIQTQMMPSGGMQQAQPMSNQGMPQPQMMPGGGNPFPPQSPMQQDGAVMPPGGLAPDTCPFDINSLKLSKMDLTLENAEFMSAMVDNLHMIITGLDVKSGALSGLNIAVRGGHFKDVAFDQLNLVSQGDLSFNRDMFLNNKILQFNAPIQAQVAVTVSQESLNRFLSSPVTLQRLSVVAGNKVKFLQSMLGNGANIGIKLSEPNVVLGKSNHVTMAIKAEVGMGKSSLPIPLELQTKIGLNGQGWIALTETHLDANGSEISPLLSNAVVKKVNEMPNWGLMSGDIKFHFSDLKVIPGKQFMVKGTAEVARLRFGRQNP